LKRLKPGDQAQQPKPTIDIKLKPTADYDALFYASMTKSKDGILATQQDSVISDGEIIGREQLSFAIDETDINQMKPVLKRNCIHLRNNVIVTLKSFEIWPV
jgi:hypothetical protein